MLLKITFVRTELNKFVSSPKRFTYWLQPNSWLAIWWLCFVWLWSLLYFDVSLALFVWMQCVRVSKQEGLTLNFSSTLYALSLSLQSQSSTKEQESNISTDMRLKMLIKLNSWLYLLRSNENRYEIASSISLTKFWMIWARVCKTIKESVASTRVFQHKLPFLDIGRFVLDLCAQTKKNLNFKQNSVFLKFE